jgi:hypothetical protein
MMAMKKADRLLFGGLIAALSASACNCQTTPGPKDEVSQAVGQALADTPSTALFELMPPKVPKVTCNGDQLTISADNSTLGSVLTAVQTCIGIQVDIPEGAAESRVFEELGPGPARQVLDSLLSGTDFNFVIGSSVTSPERIEIVSLMARPVEAPNAHELAADRSLSTARRAWLQSRQNRGAPLTPDENHPAADETPSIPETEEAAVAPAAPAADASANTTQASATDPSSPATPASPASDAPSPGDSNALSTPTTPSAATVQSPIAASPSSDASGGTEQKISEMQQLFQQRRLMNQNQNQSPGQNPSSPQP